MARTSLASLTSSPDLLGEPGNNPRSSPVRESKRAFTTTPTKQRTQPGLNGAVQLQDFYLTTPTGKTSRQISPSRSIAEAENLISPWRIRVRVEAEREEEDTKPGKGRGKGSSTSPSKRVARTITTTVPLRDEDHTQGPQKRGRGRPRKSSTPVKRPGTPKPGPGRPRKRAADEDTDGASDASRASPKRAKKQQAPSRATPQTDGGDGHDLAEESAEISRAQASNVRSRTERDHIEAENFDIALDSDASMRYASETDHEQVPLVNGAGEQSQARRDASKAVDGLNRQPLASMSSQQHRLRKQPMRSQKVSIPSDPTAPHSGYDSILEGEDFSVVSLSTLPSAQQHLGNKGSSIHSALANPSPALDQHLDSQRAANFAKTNQLELGQSSATSRSQTLSQQTQHSSNFNQSSILHIDLKRKTPSQIYSSPQLPPVPQAHTSNSPRALLKPTSGTPRLARVVRAGIALQGVLEPNGPMEERVSDQTPDQAARDRLDDLFSGFGVATRRELRAGLRLGEELARRQLLADERTQHNPESEDDVFQAIAKADGIESPHEHNSTNVQKLMATNIQYPPLPSRKQLPSPETSSKSNDEGGLSSQTKMTNEALILMAKADGLSDEERRQRREALWQEERDAVSRLIDAACPNDVVDLKEDDSDSEKGTDTDEDNAGGSFQEEETDIWQSEARTSVHLRNESSQSNVEASAKEEAVAKRSCLPDSWKGHVTEKVELPKHELSQNTENHVEHDSMLSRKPRKRFTPYATPSPKRPTNFQNANFTGLTNFTADMETENHGHPEQSPTKSRLEDSIKSDNEVINYPGLVNEASQKESTRSIKSMERASLPAASEKPAKEEKSSKWNRAATEPASHDSQNAALQARLQETRASSEKAAAVRQKIASKFQSRSEPLSRSAILKNRSQRQTSKGLLRKSQQTNVSMIVNTSSTNFYSQDTSQNASVRLSDASRSPSLESKEGIWTMLLQTATTPLVNSAAAAMTGLSSTTSFLSATASTFASTLTAPSNTPAQTFKPPTPPSEPSASPLRLTTHLPFNDIHWTFLRGIYLAAQRHPRRFPLRHDSPSTRFINREVESVGWRRKLQPWELGVVDEFMTLLLEEGQQGGEAKSGENARKTGAKKEITEEVVVVGVFALWVCMVMRGEVLLTEGTAGMWDETLVDKREEVLARQREWLERTGWNSTGWWSAIWGR